MSAATLITVAPTAAEAHTRHVTARNRLLDEFGVRARGAVHADFVMGGPGSMPATGNPGLVERATRLAAQALRPAASVDRPRRLLSLPTRG